MPQQKEQFGTQPSCQMIRTCMFSGFDFLVLDTTVLYDTPPSEKRNECELSEHSTRMR